MSRRRTGARLGRRIMALLLVVLALLLGLLLYSVHRWQREEILRQARQQAEAVAHTMVASLKMLMLNGDAESVRDWLGRMRSHPELQSVEVLRRDGTLAFRDLKTLHQVNRFLGLHAFLRRPLPPRRARGVPAGALHRAVAEQQSVVVRDRRGRALTLLEPIRVEQACLQCHGYEHEPVRGVLRVTTSTDEARAMLARADRTLLLMGVMGLGCIALLMVLLHRYMEAIIRALGGMLFVTDAGGVIRMVNDAAVRVVGRDDLVGRPMASLLAPGHERFDFTQERTGGETVLRGGGASEEREIPVSVFTARMPWGGRIEGVARLHVLRDLTQQKESEREMRLAATVMDTVPSAIMVADRDVHIRLINPAFTAITGYGAEEAIGRNPRILASGRQSKEFYAAMWRSILDEGHWEGEIWNRRKSGEIYPEWLIINTLRDEDGEILYYVSTFLDITEQKEMERKLRHSAYHDALTDLPNRVLLYDRLEQAISRAHRFGRRVGVLFVDIDGFKPVNDNHGHDAGDLLLQQIAGRLQACVRASDTVARVGGDEFVLLLESRSAEDIAGVARKVLHAMQQPFPLEGGLVCHIGASIGISIYPEHGVEREELVKRADAAMYVAKKGGKNRIVVYDRTMVDADEGGAG
ncbi:MAG: sensor domain-containing diguanylate cyclase [Zetaproteobacteria bacterium]|nr:MAG: sensor domain-containing diguanylate cyclase [Zetaproteobacteria bacterium]